MRELERSEIDQVEGGVLAAIAAAAAVGALVYMMGSGAGERDRRLNTQ